MPSPLAIAILILLGVESVFGVITGLFIMAVLLPDWVNNRTLNACYLILVSLGLSNICFMCTLYADIILFTVDAWIYYSSSIFRICHMGSLWASNSNACLTAWLCIFYCLKIVEINHSVFIKLKLRISKTVPWMIFILISISLAISLPVYWDSSVHRPQNATAETPDVLEVYWSIPYIVSMSVLGAGLPFLLVVLSLTPTLRSLWKHAQKMKQNATDFSQPQLDALSGAGRTMICLLILYISFYMTKMATILDTVQSFGWNILCTVVSMSYAPAQSFVIIMGNSKLKKTFMRMFHCS